MTPTERRAALLDFARSRLPEGAQIFHEPAYEPDDSFDVVFSCGISVTVNPTPFDIWMDYSGADGDDLDSVHHFSRVLASAIVLGQAIEAFARALPAEEPAA